MTPTPDDTTGSAATPGGLPPPSCSGGVSYAADEPVLINATGGGALTTAKAATPASSQWVEPSALGLFKLTANANRVLKGVWGPAAGWVNTKTGRTMKEPPSPIVRFGFAGPNNSGITLAGVVTLSIDSWNRLDEAGRIQLIGHECTHIPQWSALGDIVFLARYHKEYARSDNYSVPSDLAATAIMDLEPDFTDARWTMDQMAERTGNEAVSVARSFGFI